MKFNVVTKEGSRQEEMVLKNLLVVGFAGKDIEKTMEHIHELEEAGIKCPRKVPVLYQCEKQILTEKDEIEVIGNKTARINLCAQFYPRNYRTVYLSPSFR